MKYQVLKTIGMVLCFWNFYGNAQKQAHTIADAVYGFENPQDMARTKVWWWHGDVITTREGITADLEAFKKAGVGGVVYYDQMFGKGKGALKGLSQEWFDMIRFSAEEAKRLGLSFEINISNGFVAGGSHITYEHAMKRLTAVDTVISGGQRFEGKLAEPASKYDFYRDVAVLAFPAPAGKGKSTLNMPFKATSNASGINLDGIFDQYLKRYPIIAVPEKGKSVYINIEFSEEFTARSFTYEVNAKGKSTTGAMNVPGSPSEEFWGDSYTYYPNLGQLEVSQDGIHYSKVCDILPVRSMPTTITQKTIAFNATKGKYFRLNLHDWWLDNDDNPDLGIGKIVLSSVAKVDHWEDKAGLYSDFTYIDKELTPVYSAREVIDRESILNLTDKMSTDGTLRWDVPDGDWMVMRIGYIPTGGPNRHGRKELGGLECDKLSTAAARFHWEHYPQRIIDSLAVTGSGKLEGITMDSHEAGAQNWTETFLEEFIQRQGYDPTFYLPAMMGYIVDGPRQSNKFLYDVRRNIADMIADNYFGTFQRLCTARGLTLTAQAIGNGLSITGDPIQAKSIVDKPQGEFWVRHTNGDYDIKESASAAHLYGKQIASAEAYTSVSYAHSLSDIKKSIDPALAFGINEMVVCATAYQPWTDKIPGNTVGGHISGSFNRNHTTWNYSRQFWDYQARNSYVLRQGKPHSDLCIYLGENPPVKIYTYRLPDIPAGTDFDAFSTNALLTRMDVKNGNIVLPDGVSYRMMALPRNGELTLEALKKIASLVYKGASVYGPKATYSRSQRDAGNEKEYTALANKLWGAHPATSGFGKYGSGVVYWGMSLAEAMQKAGIIKDVSMKTGNTKESGINFIHRKMADGDLYFLYNNKGKAEDNVFTFASTGKNAQLWDPLTGKRFSLIPGLSDKHTTMIPLYMNPNEAYFVLITDKKEALPPVHWYKPSEYMIEKMDGPWKVWFNPKMGGPGEVEFETLYDWTVSADPGIKYYSGTAVYKKSLQLSLSGDHIFIDLGDPGYIARVFVNSKEAGVVWCPPWSLDITGYLTEGRNDIEIHVANSLANRMIYDETLPENQRVTYITDPIVSAKDKLKSSGLKEVKIIRQKK